MTVSKEADRLRKLLAHAESCTNEKEAATFFAQAAAIQQKYAITQEELLMAEAAAAGRQVTDEPIISRVIWTYEKNGELPIWVHVLSGPVCKLNQCSSLGSSGFMRGRNKAYIKGWGRAGDLEVCEEMLRVIVGQVRRLCNLYAKQKNIRDNDVLRSFRMGCTNTITEKMNQAKALADAEVRRLSLPESTQSTALMRLDSIAVRVKEKLAADNPGVRTRKVEYNAANTAYADGRVAGHGVHQGGHKAIG